LELQAAALGISHEPFPLDDRHNVKADGRIAMKRTILCASLAMACFALAFAQSAASTPTFEVASVKPAPPPSGNNMFVRMGGDAGRLDYANVALKDIIRMAYRVRGYQVSGPDWLESTRFDIVAKLPEGSTREQIPEMLQALLAERFKLTVHREKKELPVFALLVGKGGPKMKEVEPLPAPGPGGLGPAPGGPVPGPGGPVPGPGTPGPGMGGVRTFGGPAGAPRGMVQIGAGSLDLKAMPVGNFCELLSRMMDRPVIDMTELKGVYDFKLKYSPESGGRSMQRMAMAAGLPPGGPGPGGAPAGASPEGGPDSSGGPSIFTAVQEQLGLKLEGRKAPVDVIVVDHVEKVPTEN
jgi:uncharacterized protein (TIGR03435 family)